MNFNPLPRKEGDAAAFSLSAPEAHISIHSLVKRETVGGGRWEDIFVISIHSLVKRETSFPIPPTLCVIDFNPLPRKEGDKILVFLIDSLDTDFNPLPRKEGDGVVGNHKYYLGDFNPLPRKEGDIILSDKVKLYCHFNPLPRKEGDDTKG